MREDPRNTRTARRALPLAALGAGAALLLTGCGADGADAPEAWAQARTQLEGADSLRVVSELRRGTEVPAGVVLPDSTDVSGPLDGDSFRYVGEFREGPRTARDESRTVGGATYERVTLEERGAVSGDSPVFAQKWTRTPAAGDSATAGVGAVVGSLLASLPAADGLQGEEAEADTLRRSGQDAVRYVLDEPVSAQEGGSVALTAFTVAADDGELLTVETESAGTGAILTFSEWDAVAPIEAPAEGDIAPAADPAAAPTG